MPNSAKKPKKQNKSKKLCRKRQSLPRNRLKKVRKKLRLKLIRLRKLRRSWL